MATSFDDAVEAIRGHSLSALEALLANDASLPRQANVQGWTLLHFAARFAFTAGFNLLLPLSDATTRTGDGNKTAQELGQAWGLLSDGVSQIAAKLTPSIDHLSVTERNMFFGASAIDRAGALRKDPAALTKVLYDSKSRVTLLHSLNFLKSPTEQSLLWMSPTEIDQIVTPGASSPFLLSCLTPLSPNDNIPTLILLGVNQNNSPLWALDVSSIALLQQHVQSKLSLDFLPARPKAYDLNPQEAAHLAQARSLLDWHARFKFCSLCGSKTLLAEAGYKRVCHNSSCVSQTSVQNSCFPRTDPVAIVCILSHDGERALLGRQKVWPSGMYSCIAGFMEPGESMEAAARREAREETGVIVGRVQYFASQPWPFPANLMLGMYGEAVLGGETIDLVDQELEDAKWFTRQEILDSLAGGSSAPLKMAQTYAIAHQLLKNWAENGSFHWTVQAKY
ncbi:NUDIX hydrolase domain-like protein [Obelidium mucronatum]|nr:NUDIX hydrolase domain-like protein [Obelidium mucronatum]